MAVHETREHDHARGVDHLGPMGCRQTPTDGSDALTDDEQVRPDVWELLNTRCLSIAGGTTQVLRNVAGERILGLPR